MIKNYSNLNEKELSLLNDFINRNNTEKITMEEMNKRFLSEHFDLGKGLLILLDQGTVVAYSQLLYSEHDKTAYIRHIDLIENHSAEKAAIDVLMTHAISTARAYGGLNIYFGLREERIKSIFNDLNYKRAYQSLIMTLLDREIKHTPLKLIKLDEHNKYEYINTFNEAFSDAPNGGIIGVKEVDEYLLDTSGKNYYFLVQGEKQTIGILEIDLDDHEDMLTIGLKRDWRNKGYGKPLLETAIDFLDKKEVEEICLTVVSKNKPAYDMYLKRGFVVKKVLTDWYVLG